MHVYHDQLEVRSHGKGLYQITDDVQSKVDNRRVRNGTVTVFVQHTSCSIVIMENADPTARRDLEEFFDRLVPENADYFTHDAEGGDDMPSHIRMVLTRTSETVPIWVGKCSSARGKAFFYSNIAARCIGERFSSPLLANHCSGDLTTIAVPQRRSDAAPPRILSVTARRSIPAACR